MGCSTSIPSSAKRGTVQRSSVGYRRRACAHLVDGNDPLCVEQSEKMATKTAHPVSSIQETRSGAGRRGLDLIRAEDSLWRALVEQSSDGIVVLDESGAVFDANERYAEILGYSMEEIRQLHVWDWDLHFSKEQLLEMLRLVDASGDHFETMQRRKDGTIVDVDLSTNGTVYRGQKLVLCIVRDITERKRIAEELRAAHDVLLKVEHIAGVGGWEMDAVKGVLSWSDEIPRMFGRKPEDLPPTIDNFLSVIHPDDLEKARHAVTAALEQNAPYDLQVRIVKPDGTERLIRTQGESTLDEAGKVVRVTGALQDVTEIKDAERRIQSYLDRVRVQLEALGAVGELEALLSGDVEALAREVTEQAAHAVGCERVNVWLFNEDETELHCIDLFEATPGRHSSGMILSDKEFRNEIAIIKQSKFIAADDPLTDPRTAGYVEPYLKPLRITSMLDVVIQSSGKHFGLLCFEHVDQPHHWTEDEISFANQLADKIGISIISRQRNQAEATTRTVERLAQIGGWQWNLADDRIVISEELGRILGRDPKVFPADAAEFNSVIHPDDVQRALDALSAMKERNVPHDLEFRIVRPDKTVRFVRTIGALALDEAGKAASVTGMTQDITERKNAEVALLRRDALLHAVAVSAKEFVTASSLDEAMPMALELVGKTLLVDRILVLDSPKSFGEPPLLRFCWQAPDIGYLLGQDFFNDPTLMTPEITAWQAPLFEGKFVLSNRREASGDLKAMLERVGTKTILLMPIMIDGKYGGQVAVETCKVERAWADFEIEILRMFGDLITNSVRRERYVAEIANANRIILNTPTILYRLRGTPDMPLIYVSQNVRLLGHEPAVLMASPHLYKNLFHPNDVAGVYEALAKSFDPEAQSIVHEFRVLTGQGDYRWVEGHVSPIRDPAGRLIEVEGLLIDITERKAADEKISRLARTDPLTGLANRATFMERLRQAFAASRRGATSFALLSLDIDRFKDINDTLGHPAGDELLTIVGDRLEAAVRDSDLVARLGGDEFAIIQSDLSDPSDAGVLAVKVRKTLATPMNLSGNVAQITASIGISTYAAEAASPDDMLSQADVALYRAKEEGRDQYRFHTEDLDVQVREQVAITEELKSAIEREELELQYQPQVELSTGKIVGIEALIRWNHPTRGLLMPAAFLPIAEKSGVITGIGQWVLDRACEQMSKWREAGIAPPTLGVNISSAQIKAGSEFVQFVTSTLGKWNLAPSDLELDVTESMLARVAMTQSDVLARLHELGVKIAIDDFGTKYSSLEYLRTYRINRVKIPQELIDAAPQDPTSAAIVRTIVGIARELNIEVIAQGVETEAQWAYLTSKSQVSKVQGFYYSQPVPAARAEELLRKGRIEPLADFHDASAANLVPT
jgi:diguanylate cyclase (GGDEF)-like protein/PAS domain S-box-containing protein